MLRGVDDWFAHSSLSDSCMYMYTTVKKLSQAFMSTAFSEQACFVLLIMISVSVSELSCISLAARPLLEFCLRDL